MRVLNWTGKNVDNSRRASRHVSSLPDHDKGAGAPHPTSCPQCGFDIEWGKPCRVCGYSPSGGPAAGAPGRAQETFRQHPSCPPPLGRRAAGHPGSFHPDKRNPEAGRRSRRTVSRDFSPGSPTCRTPGQRHCPAGTPAAPPSTVEADSASVVSTKVPVADSPPSASAVLSDSAPGSFDVAARTDNPPFSDRDSFVDWMVKHTGPEGEIPPGAMGPRPDHRGRRQYHAPAREGSFPADSARILLPRTTARL